MKEKTNRLYRFNGFQLEVDEGVLRKDDDPVPLTPKAFDTLVVLLENRGKVVEKEMLLNEVWADTFVEETTLAQNIFTLRKTLGTSADGKPVIETVPRRGYKFVAPVCELDGSEPPAAASAVREAEIIDEKIEETFENHLSGADSAAERVRRETPGAGKFFTRRARLASAVFALIAGAALLSFGFNNYRAQEKAAVFVSPVSSVAVLPFQTIGEQSREEKLGLGMADAIIIRLSQLQKIPVRPTSAVFRYVEHPAESTTAAGRDLGVDAVLEGTVQRDAEQVRVSVQLISIKDGRTLWAQTYHEKSSNIFALQDSISNKVAQSLALKLTPQQWKMLEQRVTEKPEAFEAYQLGVYFWNTRTRENLNKAADYFKKAIELDPQFVRARAMLADTYHLLGYNEFADQSEMYEKARVTAEEALALDDSVAEAHIAVAAVQANAGDFEQARRSIERAVELAPYNSTARIRYGWILFRLKNRAQALVEMRLAQEYDPLSNVSNGALCSLQIYEQNFAEAARACERAFELAPEGETRMRLAHAYFYAGRVEEAIKHAETEVRKNNQNLDALGSLAYFYAKSGRRADALALASRLRSEAAKNPSVLLDLTVLSFVLDRKDEAFEYFQKAYEKKLVKTASFNNDPMLKELHADRRFVDLMAE